MASKSALDTLLGAGLWAAGWLCDGASDNRPLLRHTEPNVLVELARRCGMLPVLGWYVSVIEPTSVSDVFVSATDAYRDRGAAAEALMDAAAELEYLFNAAGVNVAFRKGPHVCDYYVDPGCRPFGDLDMYVDPKDVSVVVNVLVGVGFSEMPFTREQHLFMLLATNTLPSLVRVKRGGRQVVDVSPRVLLPAMGSERGDPVKTFLARSARSKRGLSVLCPADLLLDLMINTYITSTSLRYVHDWRFQRLISFFDFFALARGFENADWEALIESIDAFGLYDVASFCLENCTRLFGFSFAPFDVPGGSRVADLIGALDQTPYSWPQQIRERVVLRHLPADLPSSLAPL